MKAIPVGNNTPWPIVLLCLLIATHTAQAQTELKEIDAQQQRMQREREQDLRAREQSEVTINTPTQATPAPGLLSDGETPCFAVSKLTLEGEQASAFQWALEAANRHGKVDDPVSAHCVGAGGINSIITRIQNAVIARGFVTTRVVAPPQNVASGTLHLRLIPGLIQSINVRSQPQHAVRAPGLLPLTPHALLNVRDIDQSLENLKRVPGANATIDISPAAEHGPGSSELQIQYQQDQIWRGNVNLDNAGSESTGPYQVAWTLSANNLLGLQDLAYVTLNHSLGGKASHLGDTRGATAYFSAPWGYNLLEASISRSQYAQTVAGLNTEIVYSGRSNNADLTLSRVVFRNQHAKTKISLGAFARRSQSFIDGLEVEVQRKATGGWQLGLEHESAITNGKWRAGLNYKRGTGAFNSLPDPGELFGETNARFRLLSAHASIQKDLVLWGKKGQLSSQWRAQAYGSRLTNADWFSIGSRYTVRGFDGQRSLSAEGGWTWRNEIGVDWLPQTAHIYLALDAGSVHGPAAAQLSGRRLIGTALGLRGQQGPWSYDISLATPLSKPKGFTTESPTLAFNLNYSF